ncbi:unnamed protein product [marine sediment metagenome]|uniref:Uncharacterized protein n=1 Tax=marine sediment metagenome TaxID=412755 RepID=X1CE03_9ZZZZ
MEIAVGSPVTIIYQHSVGAEWEFGKIVGGGLDGHQVCQMGFNTNGVDHCGPMKVIDSISVDDALLFSRITTYDQDSNIIDDYYTPSSACDQNISQLLGDTCGSIWFQRAPIVAGGCAQAIATITLTWHDDV